MDPTTYSLEKLKEADPSFTEKVLWLVDKIPKGKLATYGQLAFYAGNRRASRAVGNILKGTRTKKIEIPWHRVINAEGKISGSADPHRVEQQRRRLENEGIHFDDSDQCELERHRWDPSQTFWAK